MEHSQYRRESTQPRKPTISVHNPAYVTSETPGHDYYNRAAFEPKYEEISPRPNSKERPIEMENISYGISNERPIELENMSYGVSNERTYEVIPAESQSPIQTQIAQHSQVEAGYTDLVTSKTATDRKERCRPGCLVVWLIMLGIYSVIVTAVLLVFIFFN